MNYAMTAVGFRSTISKDRDRNYRVFAMKKTKIGINGVPKSPINKVKASDGFKYCFTVDSGFWVMRRNGRIAMTGNCGMNAIRLSLKAHELPDSLGRVRAEIERRVPLGAGGAHNKPQIAAQHALSERLDVIFQKHPKIARRDKDLRIYAQQLGTLGSGNHFIEVCLDESDDVWVMLHSGSRGIGNKIGSYFIEQAKEHMARNFIGLPDKDLAYLPEGMSLFDDYVEAVMWGQDYAMENRRFMMTNVLAALAEVLPPFSITKEAINCHHNYVDLENHYGENVYVTRKGAIRAREGDLGIIPGSMGTRSYIVRGKGNKESFCSCSHGAGRRLSRGEASRTFTEKDLAEQTAGIECRKDAGVIDEIPAAYKNIDEVMANQTDLVEVLHELRQVVNVKG